MSRGGQVQIEAVPVEVVLPLRRAILRANLPAEESTYAQDGMATTLHLAARAADGEVVGVCTWFPDPLDGRDGWRLRGMATSPQVRGTGVGARLLAEGLAEGERRGLDLVWCQARTPAVGFYRRYGFVTVGQEFLAVHGIPHYLMVREAQPGAVGGGP